MSIYNLQNSYDAEKFKKRCNELYKKQCWVEIVEKKPKQTMRQRNYLHVVLGYFALQFGYTLEEVKYRFFKELINKDLFLREKVNPKGRTIRYYRSSNDLTTEEASLAITRFRDWAASECDIYIPSADEHKLLLYCQQELEKNKEFIDTYDET